MDKKTYNLHLKVSSDADLRELDKTTQSLNKFGLGAKGLVAGGLIAGGLYATGKAFAFFTGQVLNFTEAGSAVEEAKSKFQAVFRDEAPEMNRTLEEMSDRLQRSEYDLQDWASSFQDTFVPLGFARDEAAELSAQLTELAIDVASFYDTSEAEAAARFQSALVGNSEAVRGYGIVISEASLKQELLNMGIEKSYATVTNQEKVQARLNLITKSLADAQGDAVRTGESWANQQRRLDGITRDFAATLGQKLLPVFSPVLRQFVDMADEAAPAVVEGLSAIVPVLGDIAVFMGKGISALPGYIQSASDGLSGIIEFYETVQKISAAQEELQQRQLDDGPQGPAWLQALTKHAKDDWALFMNDIDRLTSTTMEQINLEDPITSEVAALVLKNEQAELQHKLARDQNRKSAEQYVEFLEGRAIPAKERNLAVTGKTAEQLQAEAVAYGEHYQTIDGIFDQLEEAQGDYTSSQGEWVQGTRDNSGKIADIDAQLAGDLTGEQLKGLGEAYKEHAEGSAEWIAAYDALDADLSDSQRADLIRERAQLMEGQGETYSSYTGDLKQQEDASARILEIQGELRQSLRDIAVDAVLSGQGLTEGTISFLEGIGEIEEGAGRARLEFAILREEVTKLTGADAFGSATASVQTDAFNLLADGMADTAGEALGLADAYDRVASGEGVDRVFGEFARAKESGALDSAILPTIDVNTDPANEKLDEVEAKSTAFANSTYESMTTTETLQAHSRLASINRALTAYDLRVAKATIDVELGPNAKAAGLGLHDVGGLMKGTMPPEVKQLPESFVDPVTGEVVHRRQFGGALLPGGNYIVGDAGPELIQVPTPSAAYPNFNMGGGGGIVMENNIVFGNSDLESHRSELLFQLEDIMTAAATTAGVGL